MKKEREPRNEEAQENIQQTDSGKSSRSSAFNEQSTRDRKQTTNPEEEADLEQERKEAMRERD